MKVKVEPCNIMYPYVQKCTTPPLSPCEKVRSSEISQKTVSKAEKEPKKWIPEPMRNDLPLFNETKKTEFSKDSWIVKREDGKVYAKDGSVLFECQFCRNIGKQMFFATQHDLDLHVRRRHES